ncbi:substrate-binding domain-containing protein [Rhodobacteraceae bacterium MCCB 386]|nr:substrate-binding domain-containing protein [Roseitranquillus sediminis]
MAIAFYGLLRSRGLRIPDDISVAGHDDHRLVSETLYPALTTVELNYRAIGRRATEMPTSLLACTVRADTASAQTEISMWYHGARNEMETAVLLQRLDGRGGAAEQPALPPRCRRTDHAELGLVRPHAAARDRRERGRPTRHARLLERRALFVGFRRRRGRELRGQSDLDAGACAPRRSRSCGQARSSWRRSTRRGKMGSTSTRSTSERPRRVISLCFPAVPAVPRRQPRRPRNLPPSRSASGGIGSSTRATPPEPASCPPTRSAGS